MRIDHIALWVKDLEAQRAFYEKFFQAKAGEKYTNPIKNFQSYFLSFEGGARLELMHKLEISAKANQEALQIGIAHFAIAVGSKDKVDELTALIKENGLAVIDGPRTTGDGYYESVIIDPEGNRIEITI